MNLSLEWGLYAKLKSLEPSCPVFDGLTTYEERRENMKAAIQRIGPEVTFTVRNGKIQTLAQEFSRVYSQDWE